MAEWQIEQTFIIILYTAKFSSEILIFANISKHENCKIKMCENKLTIWVKRTMRKNEVAILEIFWSGSFTLLVSLWLSQYLSLYSTWKQRKMLVKKTELLA